MANVPWHERFYDPALFDASAGDSDSAETVAYYRGQLAGSRQRVLDIGCGTGRMALMLLDDGHHVLGLDNSTLMLSKLEQKAAMLSDDIRARLTWQTGNFIEIIPDGGFDAIIAADDFVSHFSPDWLHRFFLRAAEWLVAGGVLLTDMRERSASRLDAAAASFPKPMLSHGLVGGLLTQDGERHVAMTGWEEYEPRSGKLVTHQRYSYIRDDGSEERTEWRTLCQYNHSNEAVERVAQQAGFRLIGKRGRRDLASVLAQGGFFRFELL